MEPANVGGAPPACKPLVCRYHFFALEVSIGAQCILRAVAHPVSQSTIHQPIPMNHLTKDQFVAVLEAAGITATQREKFHAAFEHQHPAAHQQFLEWLGLPAGTIGKIRAQSRK